MLICKLESEDEHIPGVNISIKDSVHLKHKRKIARYPKTEKRNDYINKRGIPTETHQCLNIYEHNCISNVQIAERALSTWSDFCLG